MAPTLQSPIFPPSLAKKKKALPQFFIRADKNAYPVYSGFVFLNMLVIESAAFKIKVGASYRSSLMAFPNAGETETDEFFIEEPGVDWQSVTEGELLEKIDLPIDFIAGELSEVVPGDLGARIGKALRNGRGPITIPSAHHHVPVNQPLALVAALRALLF